jgi:hypothetical protein
MSETTITDAAKKLAELKEHNRITRLVWNKDFKPLKKEDKLPEDVKDGGFKLTHPENKELFFQLDLLHVQRGDDKGMKYPGKRITKDNLESFIEFFGADYVASRVDTAFNTENQRFSLGSDQYKAITPENELIDALTTRTIRTGDSLASMKLELQKVGEEFKTLIAAGKVTEAMVVGQKMAELAAKVSAK